MWDVDHHWSMLQKFPWILMKMKQTLQSKRLLLFFVLCSLFCVVCCLFFVLFSSFLFLCCLLFVVIAVVVVVLVVVVVVVVVVVGCWLLLVACYLFFVVYWLFVCCFLLIVGGWVLFSFQKGVGGLVTNEVFLLFGKLHLNGSSPGLGRLVLVMYRKGFPLYSKWPIFLIMEAVQHQD